MEIDFEAHYKVKGFRGFAFYLLGYEPITTAGNFYFDEEGYEFEEEPEVVENRDNVRAIMMGDDKIHIVAVSDLTKIEEDDFCHSCGQIGCRCS